MAWIPHSLNLSEALLLKILKTGNVDDSRYRFNAELVENAIMKMKCGKTAGLDNITVEHLRFSHYLL